MAEKSTKQYLRSTDINQKLIASIDNGIIVLDSELKILYYNQWLELHTSIKEESVLQKFIGDVFKNINLKTLQRKVKTALRMGTPSFYTASVTNYLIPIKINQLNVSDFEHMRQDVSVIPFDTEKGLVALIITDQTNMTNTHNQLQANIQKVHELNLELLKERETIDERVILTKINNNNCITEISKAYIELLGLLPKDILGRDIFELEKLTIAKKLKKDIFEHIEKKQVFKYDKVSLDCRGKEIWLSNTLVPEYDKNAQHVGFIIFGENITSAKLVQNHQAKLLENSRTAAMGEMISMIAHQWRQPLSVINTVIATLKIKKELNILNNETVDESYTKIETTVHYLSETIDDFRNFFKQNKELKTLTIEQLFNKSTQLLKSEMDIYNITYEEDIDKNIEITTYQNELVQTLINVVKNSIDAFKELSLANQKLTVKAYEEQTHIVLEIEDNAGGIPKNILKKVFEPYFSTKSKNGTGLGLYVSKTIIEEHLKGKITMRSHGKNTLTIIELPKVLQTKEEV